MKLKANHRRSPRRTVRMLCQAVRERDFSLVGDVALDLSAHGMLVRTSRRVLTGEPMLVSFFEPHNARWFDLEATIARVVHNRRTADRERCVALEFHGVSAADRARLSTALAARPAVTPDVRGERPRGTRAARSNP